MGVSNHKIKVAIINEDNANFDVIKHCSELQSKEYMTYELFLENQSLKELSYIIIRQKETKFKDQTKNSMESKKLENQKELQFEFKSEGSQPVVPSLRQKLITYIKKYSLQKLVIYVYVKELLNFKIMDYELPYITLVAEDLNLIKEHIKKRPKREEPAKFKFNRLVKDLYRRATIAIIVEITGKKKRDLQAMEDKAKMIELEQQQIKALQKQWSLLTNAQQMQVIFYSKIQQFEDGLVSNYCDFIIVSTPQMVTYMIDARKLYQLESKLIYYGKDIQVQSKKQQIWMISGHRDEDQDIEGIWSEESYKKKIISTIIKCSHIISNKTSMLAKRAIIYLSLDYKKQYKNMILSYMKQNLSKKFEGIQFQIAENYLQLEKTIIKTQYSYLMIFDCIKEKVENLKEWIKQNNFSNRVYLYEYIDKVDIITKKDLKKQEQTVVYDCLKSIIEGCLQKAKFMIKFETGPIQSLFLYDMSEKEYKYFQSKMGLMTVRINKKGFQKHYCQNNRVKIIENYHIVSGIDGYFELQKLLLSQKDSYFKDICVIIYDKKQNIKDKYLQLKKSPFVAFIHYNLWKIQEYLNIIQVKNLKLTVFIKKSLPNYLKAVKNMDQSKSRLVQFTGMIVSKNQLLKEVFDDPNFQMSSEYQIVFRQFSYSNKSQYNIERLHQFIQKFGILWRVGYDIFKNNEHKAKAIQTLKEDIKRCLFKCKFYSLIDVTDEEFEYFYIKRLDLCKTYLDLQISVIYILSLPHGFNKVLNQIFSKPRQSSMTPKVFAGFIITLLSNFCCIEDEVMTKICLVFYVQDPQIIGKMSTLSKGDTLFNRGFVFCGKNEDKTENDKNHCFFIEFENIPMLSETFIRDYLYIERFSFYKESTQYLIAPYIQFNVVRKELTPSGRFHIYLTAVDNRKRSFIKQVLQANSIKQDLLFECIKEEITAQTKEEQLNMLKGQKSLYKKAQLISLNDEKADMIKSIIDSYQYKNFLNAMAKEKYVSALFHIKNKENSQKTTTQIQALYFKKMLGLEKSLIWFKLCEYKLSIKELNSVLEYLENERLDITEKKEQNWEYRTIAKFKSALTDICTKRGKLLNRIPKEKHWKVYPIRDEEKVYARLQEQDYSWSINFFQNKQQFYLQAVEDEKKVFLPHKIQQRYGDFIHTIDEEDKLKYDLEQLEKIIAEPIKQYIHYMVDHKDESKGKKNKNKPKKDAEKTITSKLDEAEVKPIKPIQSLPKQPVKVPKEPIKEPKQETKPPIQPIKKQVQEDVKPNKPQIKQFQKIYDIKQSMTWQVFYYQDKFIITKKGKHIKEKLINNLI